MAYPGPCHPIRVNYYSNPSVILPETGTPTGVADEADNARVFRENIAAFAEIGDESAYCPTAPTTTPTTTTTTTTTTIIRNRRHENINSLDLKDTSFPLTVGALVPCGGQVDMRNSTIRHFQTPNYPLNYPNGKAGRCSWTFILPPNPKIICEKFHVKKGDRLCIKIKNNATFKRKKCYYGMKSESFSFPLLDVSSAFSNESTMKMVFWPTKRRASQGFKFVVFANGGVPTTEGPTPPSTN